MWEKSSNIKSILLLLGIIILIPIISYLSVQISVYFGLAIDYFLLEEKFYDCIMMLGLTSVFAYIGEKVVLAYFEEAISNNIVINFHDKLVKKINSIEYGRFLQWNKSDLFQMCSKDIFVIKDISFHSIISLVLGCVTGIMAVIELAQIYVWFPVIVIAIYLLSLVVVKPISKMSKKYSSEVRNSEKTITRVFMELLAKFELIKSFGRFEQYVQSFSNANDNYNKNIIKAKIASNFYRTLNRVINAIAPIAIVLVGSLEYRNGCVTIGEMVTAVGLLSSISYPIQSVGQLAVQIKTNGFKINHMINFLGEADECKDFNYTIHEFKGDIKFSNVSYKIGETIVLNNISFTIPYGKKTALIGSTGSGKSTIANLLSGLLKSTEGTIFFGDCAITDENRAGIRYSLSYVPSSTFLINDTLEKNLNIFSVENRQLKRIKELLGITALADCLPLGFQTKLGNKGQHLSGGQQKKIGIARGLSIDRNYYLLDEVTTGLDKNASSQITNFIFNRMEEKTILHITHDISEIKNYDHIVMLDNGQVCGEGTHDELYLLCEKYRELYDGKEKREIY